MGRKSGRRTSTAWPLARPPSPEAIETGLDGVASTFTDFGTSNHTPEDYLDELVGFALYTTDGLPPGELRLIPPDEYDGIITAVNAEIGALAAPGMGIVEIADVSPLRLTVQIDEIDVRRIRVGMDATIKLDALAVRGR